MKRDVITIADLVADLNLVIPRLPLRANEHQPVREMFIVPGGNGNFIIAGQRLGLRMRPISPVGDDGYGNKQHDCHEAIQKRDATVGVPPRETQARRPTRWM